MHHSKQEMKQDAAMRRMLHNGYGSEQEREAALPGVARRKRMSVGK